MPAAQADGILSNRSKVYQNRVSEVASLMPTPEQIRKSIYHMRRADNADQGFLLELYAQGRASELSFSGMNAIQREVFLQMQFRARQASCLASYPEDLNEIICLDDGTPVGRVLVDRTGGGMHLVDIAIFNARQRQGAGRRAEVAGNQGERG